MTVAVKKVPPNGGYAWVVMIAYAMNAFFTFPVMQNFGLIYKDTFEVLQFSATQISMILNTCAAFSMLIGIINGPLLKQFGFRKVSFMAAAFIVGGVLLTSRAMTFNHFMISHGFITAFGMGLGMSSYSLALNSYFTTRRGKATGLAMTIAGLGPILIPQLISFLLYIYGVKYAMLILGAIVSHAFVSALLLQPVKWHMKDEVIEEGTEEKGKKSDDDNIETEAIIAADASLSGSMWSLNGEMKQRKKGSKEMLNLEEKEPLQPKNVEEIVKEEKPEEKVSLMKRIGKSIVDMFDLKLLTDPIYLNIMIGMSLAIFAEMNFSVLTPFILGDYDLSIQEIATFMSVVAILDIIFRFCAPFVGDLLKQSHRVMYLFSMLLLIITRFSLLLTNEYKSLLAVATALGIAKGFRTVYYALVIPSYVPVERLAAAMGIQMTVNGLCVLVGGPVIGFIRDVSGTYKNCIYVINGVTFLTFVMWTTELLYVKYKKKEDDNEDVEKA